MTGSFVFVGFGNPAARNSCWEEKRSNSGDIATVGFADPVDWKDRRGSHSGPYRCDPTEEFHRLKKYQQSTSRIRVIAVFREMNWFGTKGISTIDLGN
ncbi:hypothetical protein MKW98_025176 [Papaver atlanticum]|uniref:Uncharacterized protein n=1 Tax=Papaver atlanticum TaxID=357466 RepID=A0AAD4X7P0_9MAGN|nr:hypothetical protein MKW98_025176 [Papaver atlanticum]